MENREERDKLREPFNQEEGTALPEPCVQCVRVCVCVCLCVCVCVCVSVCVCLCVGVLRVLVKKIAVFLEFPPTTYVKFNIFSLS